MLVTDGDGAAIEGDGLRNGLASGERCSVRGVASEEMGESAVQCVPVLAPVGTPSTAGCSAAGTRGFSGSAGGMGDAGAAARCAGCGEARRMCRCVGWISTSLCRVLSVVGRRESSASYDSEPASEPQSC